MTFAQILEDVFKLLAEVPEAIADGKAIILKAHTSKLAAAADAATDAAGLASAILSTDNQSLATGTAALVSGTITSIAGALGKTIAPGSPNNPVPAK